MKIFTKYLFLFVWIIGACKSPENQKEADQRPNIIFLMADDMRYDALGYTGNELAYTPHIDKLADQSAVFTNTYVTTSICMVSRASILSGQYARRHGIDDFSKPFSEEALKQTYPLILRENGYYTGFIGKYGVGNQMPKEHFDYWKGFPGHGVYFYEDEKTGEMIHSTAMMGNQLLDFIENRDTSKPFHISVSFKAPHSEDGVKENYGFRPDPNLNHLYEDAVFPKPETYGLEYYHQFSEEFRKDDRGKENEGHVRYKMRFEDDEKFQTTVRAIYRLNSGIDRVVGRLMDFLEKKGLSGNTIIIFTSDNGYYFGERGLEGKWYGHEESIRIPLVIYDPRDKSKPKKIDQIALNIDFAPTILKYAGISIPSSIQGLPLQNIMAGEQTDWRKEFFYEHTYDPGSYPVYIPHTIGLVTEKDKYMFYYGQGKDPVDPIFEEYFLTDEDPLEKNNLIGHQEYESRIEELRKRMFKYSEELR